ncbi:MAG: YhgE/Pip domain-containing protein [Clostridioides sp.]|jgi:putative membrane protein|nr:YhgE/Pip domain-containing protein [Clostridioides sp.]
MLLQEWKDLFKNKRLMVTLFALAFVPILYSGIFLKGVWDPYGKIDNLPVAVVNEDKEVTYNDSKLDVGNELVDNLKTMEKDKSFKWEFTSKKDAESGLKSGKYYMVLEIPKDFSENASTLMDKKPKKMNLTYKTNPSRSFTGQMITKQGAESINKKIAASVTKEYSKAVFSQLDKVGDGLGEAAKGAKKIGNGISLLEDGNKKLTGGLETMSSSASKLEDGTGSLLSGIDSLSSGVSRLNSGADAVNSAAYSYTGGVSELHSKVQGALSGGGAEGASPEEQIAMYRAVLGQVEGGLSALDSKSSSLTGATESLKAGTDKLSDNIPELKSGAKKLASGASQMSAGADKLASSSGSLGKGIGTLGSGVDELDSKLKSGSKEVKNANVKDANYDMFSSPVNLVGDSISNVPNYGKGLANYIMPLGLFVGALSFSVMFPIQRVSEKGLKCLEEHKYSFLSWWISKASIILVFSTANSIIMDVIMLKCVGLPVYNLSYLLLSSWLTSITFTSLTCMLGALLGDLGKLLSMILLIVQVSSCGGIFPVELTTKFYRTANRFLPMSYSVKAFRTAIAGGISFNEYKYCILMLLGFIALFHALIILSFRLRRHRIVKG